MRLQLSSIAVAQLASSICIMLMHYSLFLVGTQFEQLNHWFGLVTFSEFFFYSSGFFIHLTAQRGKYPGAKPFIYRRLVAIYPLHLLTALFFVAVVELLGRAFYLGEGNSRLACYASTLSLTQSAVGLKSLCLNGPSWFLSALFICYLLYIPARLATQALGRRWLLVAVLAMLALDQGLAFFVADYDQLASRTFDFGALRAVPAFLAGMAVAEYLPEIRRLRVPKSAPWLLFAAIIAAFVARVPMLLSHWIMQALLLVLFVAAADATDDRGARLTPLAKACRTASFPLFLVHYPIGLVVVNILASQTLHLTGALHLGAVAVAAVVSVVAAYLIGRAKAPVDQYLLRLSPRRAEPQPAV